jgi:copper chaperone CopZ
VATTIYAVAGLTCGDCLAEVMERVRALVGVTGVAVDLVGDGPSPVMVTSVPPVGIATVRDAVGAAGFDLTGEWRGEPARGAAHLATRRLARRRTRRNKFLGDVSS